MSRSIPVVAVIAILAVAAIGTGYAYTAVYTQDMGSSEIKVSYIDVTDVSINSSNVKISLNKVNVTGDCYMDLTVTGIPAGYEGQYVSVEYSEKKFYSKVTGGTATFIAIPYNVSIDLTGCYGGTLSEVKVYEVKEVSS